MAADTDWQQMVKAVTASIAASFATGGAIWKFLDWRKELRKVDRDSLTEQKKLALEERKAEDAAEASLIKLLIEDKGSDRARIQKLEEDVSKERSRCDEELTKLRMHFEGQIANAQQAYNAQIDNLRGEIRGLITEVATVKAENIELKRDLDAMR